MRRIYASEIKKRVGEQVKIAGFVQAIRNQGGITFLIIRDISGVIQVVIKKGKEKTDNAVAALSLESVVEIAGLAKEEHQAPGGVEVAADTLTILSLSAPELPIPVVPKGSEETDQSIRLDWRWIDLRKPKNLLIFKVWTLMEATFRKYWLTHGYLEIHSPKLISAASESGAEVFEVKYFDRKAYLAQSPQFYKQMAMAAGLEKVFEVGPVFRAEPSFTSRHATEFTGYDTEISYISSHKDIMREIEKTIRFVLQKVKDAYGEEIKETFGREIAVPAIPFPKISMKEAKRVLKEKGVPSDKEGDISPEEEKALCAYAEETQGHEFIFVTEYPPDTRAFYHMRDKNGLTKGFDLLWNGVEVVTGAQREHRYDILVAQAKEKGINVESLQFYLDFFKYGCPPHGGYGMGPARMMMNLLGTENVREVTCLRRGVKRLTP